jgi:TatD DNase family protein
MTLFDTHCHLTDEAFANDVEEVISRTRACGVERIIQACVDEADFELICKLQELHPDLLLPTLGIHPENIAEDLPSQLERTRELLEKHHDRIYAIGEVGLDLHWTQSNLKEQKWLLSEQVHWSLRYDLPILLHIRDAMKEFIDFLSGLPIADGPIPSRLRGIMHCYSGTLEEAHELLKHGDFLFGVGGTLTYKKCLVPEVVRGLGIERLVLETDAPYLAPVPHRGKRNEPAYVADTARVLAAVLDMEAEEVARITTENARKLFRKEKKQAVSDEKS